MQPQSTQRAIRETYGARATDHLPEEFAEGHVDIGQVDTLCAKVTVSGREKRTCGTRATSGGLPALYCVDDSICFLIVIII